MRHPLRTGGPPGGPRLAALLLSITIACGERTTILQSGPPPAAFPTAPQSASTAVIYLADANGTVRGQLTKGGWPSWSPDGRRIVFHRDRHVRVIGADGTDERELSTGQWPTWSPDGSRIAFATFDGISVMNADGSAVRPLMSAGLLALHDWGVGKPSWSPDGALIAFDEPYAYDDGVGASIYAMSADGTSQFSLAGYDTYESEPSWSPDGSRVVYWSFGIGLAIVARSGGLPVPLNKSQAAPFFARPAWSPDGRAILFNGKSQEIMAISPDGGSARVFIDRGADAAWSPDGTRLAFVRLEPR